MRNIIVTTKIKILIDNDVKLKTHLCFVYCINYSLLLSVHEPPSFLFKNHEIVLLGNWKCRRKEFDTQYTYIE